MSNHQSLLDVPLIFASLMGSIRFVAKKELFAIPILGKAISASGFVSVDRKNILNEHDFTLKMKAKLDESLSLWIFPEGTRSLSGELQHFKAGAFRVAREMGAVIVPVGISGTRNALPAGTFDVKTHQKVFIRVGKPIDTRDYTNIDSQKDLIEKTHFAIAKLMQECTL